MKPKLIKDYFSMPKGTVCEVLIKGEYYHVKKAGAKEVFATFTKKERDEYLTK